MFYHDTLKVTEVREYVGGRKHNRPDRWTDARSISMRTAWLQSSIQAPIVSPVGATY